MQNGKFGLLCVVLALSLALSACGAPSGANDPSNDKTPSVPNTTESNTTNEQPAAPEQTANGSTIDEQVLLDRDGIIITTKSIEDGMFGPEIKILIENNSDTNVTIQARDCTVNGIMVEPMFSVDVAAGKKANDDITFMSSNLEAAQIEVIKDISLKFHVFKTDGWDTVFDTEQISFVANKDADYSQTYDDSGEEVLNRDGFRIVVKQLDSTESFWGADLYLYVENNSGTDATIQVRDVSVNGFMLDPMFSCDILNGMKAYDSITFLQSDFEENGITDIETLELSFHVFTMDGWDTMFDTDAITITF